MDILQTAETLIVIDNQSLDELTKVSITIDLAEVARAPREHHLSVV
jgi:hypothetical protein